MLRNTLNFDVANCETSNQNCTTVVQKKHTEYLSQVFKPQKVAKMLKIVCHVQGRS